MFDLSIKSETESLLKQFPETIEPDSKTALRLKSPRFIITEMGGQLSVGVTVRACERLFTPTENGLTVTEREKMFGEFECISADATLSDIIAASNRLVDNISKAIAAWG